MKTIAEQIAQAKSEGVQDSYGFAEWLVQGEDHFGPIDHMPEYEMEMAYEQAQGWWTAMATP